MTPTRLLDADARTPSSIPAPRTAEQSIAPALAQPRLIERILDYWHAHGFVEPHAVGPRYRRHPSTPSDQ